MPVVKRCHFKKILYSNNDMQSTGNIVRVSMHVCFSPHAVYNDMEQVSIINAGQFAAEDEQRDFL